MVYNANSIETLSFRDAVRQRVAMYMGSADNQGVLQCIREIITNSIDEATMGFGKRIVVEIDTNQNMVTVKDNGRGVPFGIRDDGIEAMEAIYTMPHTGGKFNEKMYQNVAGMNGTGAKGTALSSQMFMVGSFRDGECATLKLENGIKTYFNIKKLSPHDKSQGTVVTFIPSQEVYNLEPIKIEFEEVRKMCRDWSYLMKGIEFIVIDKVCGIESRFLAKNGLLDMMKDNKKKPLNKTPLNIKVEENGVSAEIVMEWTDSSSEECHVFTNGLENPDGGTSLTGIKTALTNFFKKKLKGSNEKPDILRKGLYYAVSCKVPNPSFANQTKNKVNNPELRGLCQRATTQMLEDFERKHSDEFGKIIDILTTELKAEAAAEKARQQILNVQKEVEKTQKKKVFASDKLKDAEFLGEQSTLLLVEGLSAASSIAQARDEKRFGILALRGKSINAFTNSDEKIYQNEEVKLLLSAMNIIPGRYDSSKLRYGKIGICVDADSDGYSIGLLIMCMLYKFAPRFIEEGRLCWLRSPIYIVKNGKKEEYYFTDQEFQNRKSRGGIVQRNKGLGSLDADQARASMFDPVNQRLEVLKPDDESLPLLLSLMGKDSTPKRDFIFSNIDFSEIRE